MAFKTLMQPNDVRNLVQGWIVPKMLLYRVDTIHRGEERSCGQSSAHHPNYVAHRLTDILDSPFLQVCVDQRRFGSQLINGGLVVRLTLSAHVVTSGEEVGCCRHCIGMK